MTNVVPFPIRKAVPGTVYCQPLQITFPKLYRATVNTTEADLEEIGISDRTDQFFVSGKWEFYDLDPSNKLRTIVGAVTWDEMTHISSEDTKYSLIIRHHCNKRDAINYLVGREDVRFEAPISDSEDDYSSIYETPAGIFTLVSRPTPATWEGPLLWYMAELPNDDLWVHVVSNDGTALDPARFGLG